MSRDWGFDERENAFIEAAVTLPPDMAKIRELLAGGIDINRVSKSGSETLAYCILNFYGEYDGAYTRPLFWSHMREDGWVHSSYDTTHLVEMVQLFLSYSLDLSMHNGNSPLEALLFGANDENALRAVEVLLQYGADPNVCDENGENLCDWANREDSMVGFTWNLAYPKPGLPDYFERLCRLLAKYGGRPNSGKWPY
ncbi:MAG: ankyrin repeat domain-containing protein [Candidatus Pelethousia sp.]|nr:ankyrin repeat domain-containing protein [Candidatus Pelethousia sp.]